jgi:hypothetical protein
MLLISTTGMSEIYEVARYFSHVGILMDLLEPYLDMPPIDRGGILRVGVWFSNGICNRREH